MTQDAAAELLAHAREALRNAYSPYSRFPVGAAVRTRSGKIFPAPNIENASYGLALCAERNAVFHAVSAGEREICALALYTPTSRVYTPCGACRQVLAEFLDGAGLIICAAESGAVETYTLDELLPAKFSL